MGIDAPALRFTDDHGNDFPDWKNHTIGDFITAFRGGAPLTPSDFCTTGSHLVFPKKYLVAGGKLPPNRELTFCTKEFFENYPKSIIDSSYLITTLRDLVPSGPSIGYIVKYDNSDLYMLAQGVYGLKVDENALDRRFLVQFSNTSIYRKMMKKLMVGSTQVHIRNDDFKRVVIGVPALPEQEKIADFLTSVDTRIGQLTKKKALLEDYKKGVMQQLFTQAIRFKDDHGNDFPDWEEKTLGEVAGLINGRAYKRQELLNEGPYPVLRVGNFFSNPKWYYSDLELPDEKYCDNGDLLYAWSASFGPRIWQGGKVIYHYHIWKVQLTERVTQNYLFHFMDWDTERIKSSQSSGAIMLHVTKQSMEERLLPLPCVSEQTKIAAFLSAIDRKIESVANQITETQTFKRGLLQQMFV